MKDLIQFINVGAKSKFSMTLNRKLCLTLSNAFPRSSFMIIPFSFLRMLEAGLVGLGLRCPLYEFL
jgi:hypothetical protein